MFCSSVMVFLLTAAIHHLYLCLLVGNLFGCISEVSQLWAKLLLGWVIVVGNVNRLGM